MTEVSQMPNLPIPHGTHAETASLELPFIGFCSVSVSVGSLPEPPSGHPPVLTVRERSLVVSNGAQSTRRIPDRLPLWRVRQRQLARLSFSPALIHQNLPRYLQS